MDVLRALAQLEAAVLARIVKVARMDKRYGCEPAHIQQQAWPLGQQERLYLWPAEIESDDLISDQAVDRAMELGSSIAHRASDVAPPGAAWALRVCFVRMREGELGRLFVTWDVVPVACATSSPEG